MNRAASVLVVVLAACAGDEGAGDSAAGTNPPMLWLAMSSGSQMSLVDVEPRPY
jgi:hypothetical protein